MPIDRIAKYIERFAAMLGNGNNVHLMSVDSGSCALRSFADEPAIPKIRERVHRINEGTAPLQAQRARTDLDDLLDVFLQCREYELAPVAQRDCHPGRSGTIPHWDSRAGGRIWAA